MINIERIRDGYSNALDNVFSKVHPEGKSGQELKAGTGV